MYLIRCDKCGVIKKAEDRSVHWGSVEIVSDFFKKYPGRLNKQLCNECGQAIHDEMVALLDF